MRDFRRPAEGQLACRKLLGGGARRLGPCDRAGETVHDQKMAEPPQPAAVAQDCGHGELAAGRLSAIVRHWPGLLDALFGLVQQSAGAYEISAELEVRLREQCDAVLKRLLGIGRCELTARELFEQLTELSAKLAGCLAVVYSPFVRHLAIEGRLIFVPSEPDDERRRD